ncbi:hypothetical protein [Chitinophaga sancti]|uniref:Uncharacterized protein n=1 Tax=Chitinophaga sancti TaxID=1004 RepID=A0A1K1M1C2_9BACT|nr:hypothetical protein [Chitinophaga sancti]WQD64761.1 hypothetical protein U0033_10170 [Chitinophaga sancti]WQG89617.1 hypothetical protein SR876_32305 [Chitinophaga sancti]SFW15726.1 hypothetical protein SAMN05661012_00309 [Chitinophaga sancti]
MKKQIAFTVLELGVRGIYLIGVASAYNEAKKDFSVHATVEGKLLVIRFSDDNFFKLNEGGILTIKGTWEDVENNKEKEEAYKLLKDIVPKYGHWQYVSVAK